MLGSRGGVLGLHDVARALTVLRVLRAFGVLRLLGYFVREGRREADSWSCR